MRFKTNFSKEQLVELSKDAAHLERLGLYRKAVSAWNRAQILAQSMGDTAQANWAAARSRFCARRVGMPTVEGEVA